MAVSEGNSDSSDHDSESYHEEVHLEPSYEAFRCPLTKEVMQDPVALENGQTYERGAIEKWFKECRDNGRKPTCPVTLVELNTTDMNPSLALRNAIEEWNQRNDVALLDSARKSLSQESSEIEILNALKRVQTLCQKTTSCKQMVHKANMIESIAGMMKNINREVRCKALETLRIVVEDDDDNKEAVAVGDTIRTIVKFLSHELPRERTEAVFLLFELSKSESVCAKIGAVPGCILILIGMSSSNSDNVLAIQKAEETLEHLEKCENNVLQMADNNRLQPLLRLLLEGSPETQLAMAAYLGDHPVSNHLQVLVAKTAGESLIKIMKNGNVDEREASLKALNQISTNASSAKLLIRQGILPPLIRDLFSVGRNQLPMRLKEISAAILANIVDSGTDFEAIPVGIKNQTLVSEDIICNLLHLISNTGPTIECSLLQVLVGLTSSKGSVHSIVSAIKGSGATISLIQFIEAPQMELRLPSIKLLHNVSPFMGPELADALCATSGQLRSVIKVLSDVDGISEEQVAAVRLLAELPESDLQLTRCLLREGAFDVVLSTLKRVHTGRRVGRLVNPFLEGLVRVLTRITCHLDDEFVIAFSIENDLTTFFTELLQTNGQDSVQIVSANALENLSKKSKLRTKVPPEPQPSCCGAIFPCFSKPQTVTGLCRIHRGFCSAKESFCLVEANAVDRLVACLDHPNSSVVEASLAALCTLLTDDVDFLQGVLILNEVDGISPIVQVLINNQSDSENLLQTSIFAVERILRDDDVASQISEDPRIGTALVDAFRNGNNGTRQVADCALKRIGRLPNFSGIFTRST